MHSFQVIDAKPHHVGQIIHRLRKEHSDALSKLGVNAHAELHRMFNDSSFCRAWMIDGKLAGLGGVTGSILSASGYIWLALSDDALKYPLAIIREARRQITGILASRTEVCATIIGSDATARRFATFLGFQQKPSGESFGFGTFTMELKRDWPIAHVNNRQGKPFIIYALPRSRTAWLSTFLSYRDWKCFHEQAFMMRSVEDVKNLFAQPRTGSAETAASPAWHLIHHYHPGIRVVVVRRPVEDTVQALIAAGETVNVTYDIEKLRVGMQYGDRMLERISDLPGTLTVSYDSLAEEETCRQVFQHCLPYDFDRDWWLSLRGRNIQVDLQNFFPYYWRNRDSIEQTKRVLKSDLVRLRRTGELKHG